MPAKEYHCLKMALTVKNKDFKTSDEAERMTLLVPNWLVTPADELKAAPPGPAFLSQFKATNVSRSASQWR